MPVGPQPLYLWLDTDTAGDDITALMLALCHPRAWVVGIGTVAGNVPIEQATRNALLTLQALQIQPVPPVYPGCHRPLRQDLQTTIHIQGPEGLGDWQPPPLQLQPHPLHASLALVQTSRLHPGLCIVALGPLTNLALALLLDPSLPQRVGQVVLMGGTWQGQGNQTPVTEYNLWQDPEAAHLVLHAGWPILLVPWETVLQDGVLSPERLARWQHRATPRLRFFQQVHARAQAFDQERWGVRGSLHPDALAIAVVLEPQLVLQQRSLYLTIELEGTLTRGMTVPDPYGLLGRPPNVHLVTRVDREGFLRLLEGCLLQSTASSP